MIYSALHIPTNTVVDIFDDSKHAKKEYEYFAKKYPASNGYCISSIKPLGQKNKAE